MTTPRQRGYTCHVCSIRTATAIYSDPDHNFLQACDYPPCTVGYIYLIDMETFKAMRHWFSPTKNAARTRTYRLTSGGFPATTNFENERFK